MGSKFRNVLENSTGLMLGHFWVICAFSLLYLILPSQALAWILGIGTCLLMFWTALAFVMAFVGIVKFISAQVDLIMLIYVQSEKA